MNNHYTTAFATVTQWYQILYLPVCSCFLARGFLFDSGHSPVKLFGCLHDELSKGRLISSNLSCINVDVLKWNHSGLMGHFLSTVASYCIVTCRNRTETLTWSVSKLLDCITKDSRWCMYGMHQPYMQLQRLKCLKCLSLLHHARFCFSCHSVSFSLHFLTLRDV